MGRNRLAAEVGKGLDLVEGALEFPNVGIDLTRNVIQGVVADLDMIILDLAAQDGNPRFKIGWGNFNW